MGVGVSGWKLASVVARSGGLGVLSGTALDLLLTRRLQTGDIGGDIREALAAFPYPETSERILARYLLNPAKTQQGHTFRPTPQMGLRANKARDELTVAANFVEVYLARRGHDGPVGINYLEKIQLATPASVYGAMLAGVDYVLMGAGVPAQIPRLLDALAAGSSGSIDLTVDGARTGERFYVAFDPMSVFGVAPALSRPRFLAVVASHAIAAYLARDTATCPDGFVVETPIAGGHSARPRGIATFDEAGQPLYGPRDEADLEKFRKLGLPFWLAGGFGTPEKLRAARAAGAAGVQVGTAFALSRDSGLTDELRAELLRSALSGDLDVRNDAVASPTGFPFKMVTLPGTVGVPEVYDERERNCDLGYLRTTYRKDDGRVGYRCPSEPVDVFAAKGGDVAATVGRRCVCNGLAATIGLPQTRPDGYREAPLVTLGQDLDFLGALLPGGDASYGACDVMEYLTGQQQ
ncbi:MAG: hypothetical protein QOF57_969 [Frankiaceae bacterium]|nr:hypothetical protein [Frankiaceae bacterium]